MPREGPFQGFRTPMPELGRREPLFQANQTEPFSHVVQGHEPEVKSKIEALDKEYTDLKRKLESLEKEATSQGVRSAWATEIRTAHAGVNQKENAGLWAQLQFYSECFEALAAHKDPLLYAQAMGTSMMVPTARLAHYRDDLRAVAKRHCNAMGKSPTQEQLQATMTAIQQAFHEKRAKADDRLAQHPEWKVNKGNR